MRVITGAGAFSGADAGLAADWTEHLRVADLSVGTYSIPAGGTDDQEPHSEDEIYIVTTGRATLESGGERAEVGDDHEHHRDLVEVLDVARCGPGRDASGPAAGGRASRRPADHHAEVGTARRRGRASALASGRRPLSE